MPPLLDIYVLTKHRNLPTIQRFLELYVDQAASEDRAEEELMLVPLARDITEPMLEDLSSWDWEAAGTLSHAISRGLDRPRRAFSIYLKSKVKGIARAILTFTTDDLLVFGLSVDDMEENAEHDDFARNLLMQVEEATEGSLGMICVEQPPPLHERAFRQRQDAPLTVYFSKKRPENEQATVK